MTKLFSAHDARELVEAAHSLGGLYLQQETEELLAKIKHFAERGYYEYTDYKRVPEIIVRRLQELGYVVKVTDCQRDGYDCKISW